VSDTAAIILAAGASRRLGSAKQLVDLDGRPLLQHVVDMVAEWPVGGTVVVLGSGADEVLDAVDFGDATVAINDDWDEGMASSLRVGLDLLSRDAHWEQAFVVLGDQPGIPAEVPARLIDAAEESNRPTLVPVYRYERGHPVLFQRSLWPRLLSLSGDVGASDLLKSHPEWVEELRFGEVAPRDVDTAADLADLRSRSASRPDRSQ
jgi:CTP:molybdopterin cytidylyltransferase MocA